jgi:serine/threonine protein kinase
VFSYERLNRIEEGSYGVIFRVRDTQTKDIVALKKLKPEEEKHGLPITALREINALMACRHEHVGRWSLGNLESVSVASVTTNLRLSDTRGVYIVVHFT